MQNLRDKLVKSGLVDKQTAREAKTESRRQKKQQGGARAEADRAEQRRREFEERLATEAQTAREEAGQANAERTRREHRERLRNVVERWAVRRIRGDRPFYFVGPDRRVRRLLTTFEVADRLVTGELAIVAAPYDSEQDYRVVERRTALRLEELRARSYLLFWNKVAGDPNGPAYGATGPVPEENPPAEEPVDE